MFYWSRSTIRVCSWDLECCLIQYSPSSRVHGLDTFFAEYLKQSKIIALLSCPLAELSLSLLFSRIVAVLIADSFCSITYFLCTPSPILDALQISLFHPNPACKRVVFDVLRPQKAVHGHGLSKHDGFLPIRKSIQNPCKRCGDPFHYILFITLYLHPLYIYYKPPHYVITSLIIQL